MRVKQIYTSGSVRLFGERMMRKYDLVPFTDGSQPTVIYGMYKDADYELLQKVKAIVIWCGSDARIINPARAEILKKYPAKHYSKSKSVYNALKTWGIETEILPITSTSPTISCKPRGRAVYCYIGNDSPGMRKKYRMNILKGLEAALPYKFIYAYYDKYSQEEIMKIYRRCFIGIRLLEHDGLSNSILEMGLMGRRTVSNSGLPCAIPWRRSGHIANIINEEFKTKHKANRWISDATRKYIDIGDKWLEI